MNEQELDSRLQNEIKVLEGAEYMLTKVTDKQQLQSCQDTIREQKSRIEYLQMELSNMSLDQAPLSDRLKSKSDTNLARYTLFQQITDEAPLTPEKVLFLSQKAQKRRDADSTLKYGFEKYLSGDAPNKTEAMEKLEEVKAKIFILNRCLQNYKAIEVSEGRNLYESTREKVSGTLDVTVLEVTGVPTRNRKRIISVRIDNTEKLDVRLKTKQTISLSGAQDFEICFSESGSGISAFQFFPIADFIADAFKTRDPANSKPTEYTKKVWINLLPAGQAHMLLTFTEPKSVVDSKLERRKVVQKYHIKVGHKFQAVGNYQILKCSVCSEFIIGGVLQCITCHLSCHKKCMETVVPKCIAKLASEVEPDDISNKHNIPHKFHRANKLRVQWCCHCGKFLPLRGFNIMECGECGCVAHEECITFLPNLCSLPKNMLEALREHSNSPKSARSSVVKAHRASTNNSFTIEPKKEKGSNNSLFPNLGELTKSHSKSKLSKSVGGLDDFELLAVLGKGNFGKVMLAQDKLTKRYYGIKVLKKDFILEHDEVESTKSEKNVFLVVNREAHPFLVNLHSCFQTESRLFFVMEYIAGGDLMYHIQQQKFTLQQGKFYGCEVLLALQYLHQYNILYRDLKLDNILMTVDGHVKIADYGLCKEKMGHGVHTHTFCGTPEFMAPEILEERPYTRAVDWWSFGVLLYEMILGKAPFNGDNEEMIFQAILKKQPIFPSNLPLVCIEVIQQLLQKNPANRLGAGPKDALDVKNHLFFANVNWEDVYHQRITPPFKPNLDSDLDISNFDKEFTTELPVLTPVDTVLSGASQDEFKGFSHISNWAIQLREKQLAEFQQPDH